MLKRNTSDLESDFHELPTLQGVQPYLMLKGKSFLAEYHFKHKTIVTQSQTTPEERRSE